MKLKIMLIFSAIFLLSLCFAKEIKDTQGQNVDSDDLKTESSRWGGYGGYYGRPWGGRGYGYGGFGGYGGYGGYGGRSYYGGRYYGRGSSWGYRPYSYY